MQNVLPNTLATQNTKRNARMPIDMDPETMNVDELPGIWSPVQWELSEEERIMELEQQATAS